MSQDPQSLPVSPPQSPPSEKSPPPPRPAPSQGSSTGFSGAHDFVADPGPAFDPESSPEAPLFAGEQDELAAALEEGWREDTVRDLLTTQGQVTHHLLKVSEEDEDTWEHTDRDLKAIAPPLTRMLNRYDATRAAAAAGDELALGAALTVYVTRNYTKRRRLIASARAAVPQPLTGVAADPDLGPAYDEEYQRVNEPPPSITPKGRRR